MAVDADFGSVSLLMHSEGEDASRLFRDSSLREKGFFASGAPTISTTQKKFGDSSLRLYQSSVRVGPDEDFNFGAGDFTIEFFVWLDTTQEPTSAIIGVDWTTGGLKLTNRLSGSNIFRLAFRGVSTTITSSESPAPNINDQQWHHIAITRASGVIRVFRNGAVVITNSTADAAAWVPASSKQIVIGGHSGDAQYMNGYIDELRITKGVARYTSAFTPATEHFPNGSVQVSGTVLDSSGNPAARTVRAYRRDTGALIGSAISDGGTGEYSIASQTGGEVQVIALDDDGGTLENDRILRTYPV